MKRNYLIPIKGIFIVGLVLCLHACAEWTESGNKKKRQNAKSAVPVFRYEEEQETLRVLEEQDVMYLESIREEYDDERGMNLYYGGRGY